MSNVSVVIPALNEEEPIANVVREVLATGVPREIIVVDNESTDQTVEHARASGARVVTAPRGYGRACAAGVAAVSNETQIIVFLDGDGSDCPEFTLALVEPIVRGTHDFVIGSRTRGQREPGSMNAQQIFAGRLAGALIRLLYGVRYTDMCPFRAIRRDCLVKLGMREQTYGWNLEMQMKAARAGLRILEVPVNHRCRSGGVSKVSGTLRGTFIAGLRIIVTFLRIAFSKSQPAYCFEKPTLGTSASTRDTRLR
jgi:glycosyltransferase involved in cell wall biosynthesis